MILRLSSTGALACAATMTIYRRKLPHIEKEGCSYFITFHTRDDLTLNDEAKWLVLWRVTGTGEGACATKRIQGSSHLRETPIY